MADEQGGIIDLTHYPIGRLIRDQRISDALARTLERLEESGNYAAFGNAPSPNAVR